MNFQELIELLSSVNDIAIQEIVAALIVILTEPEKAQKSVEVLRSALPALISKLPHYSYFTLRDHTLSFWMNIVLLELAHNFPRNNMEDNKFICPLTLDTVSENYITLTTGYVYDAKELIKCAETSNIDPATQCPFSDFDKKLIQAAMAKATPLPPSNPAPILNSYNYDRVRNEEMVQRIKLRDELLAAQARMLLAQNRQFGERLLDNQPKVSSSSLWQKVQNLFESEHVDEKKGYHRQP